jgi:hypothetical protein
VLDSLFSAAFPSPADGQADLCWLSVGLPRDVSASNYPTLRKVKGRLPTKAEAANGPCRYQYHPVAAVPWRGHFAVLTTSMPYMPYICRTRRAVRSIVPISL